MKYIKTILFLLCSVLLNTVAHAQHSDDQNMYLKMENLRLKVADHTHHL